MQVKEVMTRGAECVAPDATLQEAARKMKDLDVGPLPDCGDNNKLVGLLTDRDIVVRAVAEGKDPRTAKVREAMTEGVCYCFEDDDTEGAAQIMANHQVRRLPVLNRNKRLVGVVALADISRAEDEAAQGALKDISEPTDKERR